MGLVERARNVVHQTLRRVLIYVLRQRDNTIYGHDAFLDIVRLSKLMNYTDGAVFDVGANSGQSALRLLREFPNKQIYSFEPHSRTFAELKKNIQKCRNVTAINAALGSENCVAEFFVYENCALNSLANDSPFVSRFAVSSADVHKVTVTRLDEFCSANGIASVHTLKIDTEGFDLEVLKGATLMLEMGRIKFIYVEFNDLFEISNATGGSLVAIGEFLRKWGFRFVASYTEYVEPRDGFFIGCNALFVLAKS
jgi:FkbM family methyltransferase